MKKKVLTLLFSVVASVPLLVSCSPKEEKASLKFAIFADVQLCNNVATSDAVVNLGATANAPLALQHHLEFCKKNNINTILLNGDITNQANEKYYQHFENILKSVYGDDESKYPEFVYNMGNHEWWWGTTEKESGDAVSMFKKHARIESSNLKKTSNVKYPLYNKVTIPSYYKVINGIPIIVISGLNSSGYVDNALTEEIKEWLSEIKQLSSVKKGGPIFVEYHYPLSTSMTHGQGHSGYSTNVERIFNDVPNAVIFTGDTHFPGNNERSINQVDFTTINLGSSSYSRMVNQSAVICDDYYNVEGISENKLVGNIKFKEAYTPTLQVVDVNEDLSFTVDRYFTKEDGEATKVGNTWKINPISSKDDFTYTSNRFQNKEASKSLYGKEGLSWSSDAKISYGYNSDLKQMTVRFPDVDEYHYCEHYKIDVNSKSYDVVSNYYKYLDTPEYNYYILNNVAPSDNFTVKVTAYDFFDNPSLNTLTSNKEDTKGTVDPIDYQSTLTYSDIQLRNNFTTLCDEDSHSALEYYYKGKYLYSSGAIASTVIDSDNTDCSNYITLKDEKGCKPTLTMKVKNPNSDDITIGLSLVKNNQGTKERKDDFSLTKKIIKPGEWTTVEYDLSKYAITSKEEIDYIAIKFKRNNPSSDGYEMSLFIDDLDILPN